MKVKINRDENNPYKLDYVEGTNIPALTRKNADFIAAVIDLDSNYGSDLDETNKPSPDYIPGENTSKKVGSTAYWFKTMKEENSDFGLCVYGAVISIDRTNSTHLESGENARKVMADRICEKCKDWKDLVNELNIEFKPENKEHLISILTDKVPAKKKNGFRYNLSFASKFCSYASEFLHANIEYSKYDTIVSNSLPEYSKIYLNKDKTNYIVYDSKLKKSNDLENDKYNLRLQVYYNYNSDIHKIINELVLAYKYNNNQFM